MQPKYKETAATADILANVRSKLNGGTRTWPTALSYWMILLVDLLEPNATNIRRYTESIPCIATNVVNKHQLMLSYHVLLTQFSNKQKNGSAAHSTSPPFRKVKKVVPAGNSENFMLFGVNSNKATKEICKQLELKFQEIESNTDLQQPNTISKLVAGN